MPTSVITDQLKIIIVEDDAIIAQLLEHHMIDFGHNVLSVCHNSEKALDKIHNLKPDLILLDINIEGLKDGIEIAETIEKNYQIPYLFITALSDPSTLKRAAEVEPVAYIVKPFREEDLRSSIIVGMSNYRRSLTNDVVDINRVNEKALSPLSEKEFQILTQLAKGLSNAQVGELLDLSVNTVKWHSQNIYSKLGVKNRTSAAQLLTQL